MSAIRACLAKLPRPSGRQAAAGAAALSAAVGGAWYLQQNPDSTYLRIESFHPNFFIFGVTKHCT
jgi:hypothetical protein